jgi:cyclic pyranopterin phosphate synthase
MHGENPYLTDKSGLVDPFGRHVTYLRLSVTDRCDFRCVYCMAEDMTFLPKRDLLTIEELGRLGRAFIRLGVRKIRLTGGEPLVRRGFMTLVEDLASHCESGDLDELTLTTNASQLTAHADDLFAAGMRRINVSLDTLDPDRFRQLTRRGDLHKVLAGIEAALAAGLKVKINTVALKGVNDKEFDRLIAWCGERGMDLTLIETMPMGQIDGDRYDFYLPLDALRKEIGGNWTLTPSTHRTGGPARYFEIQETGNRLGVITPLSQNFCEGCNRVRATCTGTLFMCLGQDDQADLRTPLRASEEDDLLVATIREAMTRKPKGHDFAIDRPGARPATSRHMSVTGG